MSKPFLKWAGGKSKLKDKLLPMFPKKSKRYIEPFLGVGSIALGVKYTNIIVNDKNSDLIFVWDFLKKDGIRFIDECRALFTPTNNTDVCYYELRDEFNTTKDNFRKAVLFVYLNRHCYNGLCRYNLDKEFNVPFGTYKIPYFPETELLSSLKKIKDFTIYNKDFREIFEMIEENDVVYCDPPYIPITDSSHFFTYTDDGFSLRDHLDLASCAEKAVQKGATVLISNHYNWYSKQMYENANKILKVKVPRLIGSKVDARDSVDEIIALYGE